MSTLSHNVSFRAYLQQDLIRRCKANSNYSLRAYSRAIGVSASALSSILNNKRTLTKKMTERLGLKLGLSLGDIQSFIEFHSPKSKAGKFFQPVEVDMFTLLSEWSHFAILELMKVKGFDQSSKWIRKKLNLSISEVNFAVERLVRAGMLTIDKNGKWIDTTDGYTSAIRANYTNEAMKALQHQMLLKAQESLSRVDVSRRDQTGITMAINSKHIGLAKEKIRRFRREISELLENSGSKDEVYQLSISFFPLTSGQQGDSK